MYQPNFPFAGQNIMRAWEVEKYPKLDGVLTLDVAAVANILRDRSHQQPGLREPHRRQHPSEAADRRLPGVPEDVPGANDTRRRYNDALVKALTERITDPARHAASPLGWPQHPGTSPAGLHERSGAAAQRHRPEGRWLPDHRAGDLMGVFLQATARRSRSSSSGPSVARSR